MRGTLGLAVSPTAAGNAARGRKSPCSKGTDRRFRLRVRAFTIWSLLVLLTMPEIGLARQKFEFWLKVLGMSG